MSLHPALTAQVGLGEEGQAFGSHRIESCHWAIPWWLVPSLCSAQADEALLSVLGAGPWLVACWQDLAVLQDKLRISTKKLEEYETLFKCQEETTQKLVLEYQARLEEGEERLRRQQEDKDIQMKGIISR